MIDEQVHADFERARNKALMNELVSAVGRRDNRLMPFHELRKRLSPEGESYRGLQEVPISKIVGSMDRYQDFDRTFLPKRKHTKSRWKNVDRAYYQDVRLPPIQLYKVGDIYFVKDGNHRVSVARERGVEFIDAEVIEGHVRVPISSEMSTEELLMQAEYAEFLRRTDLDELQPDHDIRPTRLGRYEEIWHHIEGHRQWLSWIWHRDATVHEAVNDWYQYIYMPIIQVVRDRGVLREFPRLTEADIYLWVMKNRHQIEQELGEDVGPVASAENYADLMKQPLSIGDKIRAAIVGRDTRRSPDPQEEKERRRHRLRRWAKPKAK
jgi:sarcosine oxidase delta subunit